MHRTFKRKGLPLKRLHAIFYLLQTGKLGTCVVLGFIFIYYFISFYFILFRLLACSVKILLFGLLPSFHSFAYFMDIERFFRAFWGIFFTKREEKLLFTFLNKAKGLWDMMCAPKLREWAVFVWLLVCTSKGAIISYHPEAPSTRIRINLKTDKYLYGYGFRPHVNGVFTHRKRINLKTLSRVDKFENAG